MAALGRSRPELLQCAACGLTGARAIPISAPTVLTQFLRPHNAPRLGTHGPQACVADGQWPLGLCKRGNGPRRKSIAELEPELHTDRHIGGATTGHCMPYPPTHPHEQEALAMALA